MDPMGISIRIRPWKIRKICIFGKLPEIYHVTNISELKRFFEIQNDYSGTIEGSEIQKKTVDKIDK